MRQELTSQFLLWEQCVWWMLGWRRLFRAGSCATGWNSALLFLPVSARNALCCGGALRKPSSDLQARRRLLPSDCGCFSSYVTTGRFARLCWVLQLLRASCRRSSSAMRARCQCLRCCRRYCLHQSIWNRAMRTRTQLRSCMALFLRSCHRVSAFWGRPWCCVSCRLAAPLMPSPHLLAQGVA